MAAVTRNRTFSFPDQLACEGWFALRKAQLVVCRVQGAVHGIERLRLACQHCRLEQSLECRLELTVGQSEVSDLAVARQSSYRHLILCQGTCLINAEDGCGT